MRLPRVRDQRLRQSLLPSARRQAVTRARATAACGGRLLPHRPPRAARPPSLSGPRRTPSQNRRPQGQPVVRDRPHRYSAAPGEPRHDPQCRRTPQPAGARRAQTAAWLPLVPLYPGAASTTNPVRAAVRRRRAQARHSDRRQSAAGGTGRRSLQLQCSAAGRRRYRPPPCTLASLCRSGESSRLLLLIGCGLVFEPVGAGAHDQRVGRFKIEGHAALVGGGENLHELVAGKIGEIV